MPDTTSPAATPLRHDPAMACPLGHEAETDAALIETMGAINETTFEHCRRAVRSVHARPG